MKNIIILNRSLLLGGAEKQSLILARELKKTHRVYLLLLKNEVDARFQKIIDEHKIEVHILSGGILKQIKSLIQFARKNKIDTIFSYLFSTNIVAGIGGRIAGISNIYGGYRGSIVPEFYKLVIFWFIHNFILDRTIINNHKGVSYLRKRGYISSKFTVVHNGMEVKPKMPVVESNGKVRIVTVGRFDKAKDYGTCINVFNSLQDLIPNIQLVIVGYGELEDFIRLKINEFALDHKVELHIKPDNLEQIYSSSDIYLSTSIYEGLSNTIMEAMNNALPIVATDVGDNRFLIDDGENGFICDPKDEDCLLQHLKLLVEDCTLRKKMGRLSYKKLSEEFSINTMLKRYDKILEV